MKFFVVWKDREDFGIETIEAKDEEEAWGIIEEKIQSNLSQEWLFAPSDFEFFKGMINKYPTETN